jgi:hypothetical protein
VPSSSPANLPLVSLLQTIHRPTDIKLSHFEALGVHVISDSTSRDILPDPGALPPFEKWLSVSQDDLEQENLASRQRLSNNNLSPGIKTYLERRNELSIDNTAAFRTIRRIPPPTGETAVRLGNAYEFFKNLDLFSGYWHDTSLPAKPEETSTNNGSSENSKSAEETPPHLQTHHRTGTGSQLPPEFRQHLLTAFIKLVAYDFGCNVSFPRCEPRLHLTPKTPAPPSHFNSSVSFIYRTPTDRASARSGVVEGPLAAVSCRTSTVFATEPEERLDLAREVVAVLLTAQQRAREHKIEHRFGEGKWWTTKPRWGGGPGGPIGRETDKNDGAPLELGPGAEKLPASFNETKKAIGGINGPSPSKKGKKGHASANMQIYENYRKMSPPSSTWDRKARYCAIGKIKGKGADDVFLISALNHHVSIIRAEIPESLLKVLDGEDIKWERLVMWRSRWFDLFLRDDRIEGMELIWGMMSWLMRAEPATEEEQDKGGDKMDLT